MSTDDSIKLYPLLAPIAFLYGLGVRFRNQLFKWGILSRKQYPIPVICIGNLSVGGTGKTPHTEYLIRLLMAEHRIAVLSRGYKRRSKGFVLATNESSSIVIGDEPYQMKQKFPDVIVAVDSDRCRGIERLLALPEDSRPDIILLDDAFQHRYVIPSFSIVLTDYNRLYYRDKLLPYGRLREPISWMSRADVVVATKCPDDLKPIDYRIIANEMNLYANQQLFFSSITYGKLIPVFSENREPITQISKNDEVLLIAGIASPDLFINEVSQYSSKVTSLIFPDHHDFDKNDIKKIKETYSKMTGERKIIITTEKDAARFKNSSLISDDLKADIYYLPITIGFRNGDEDLFIELIRKHIYIFEKNRLDR